ncbi:KAP P-loop domain protein [Pseudomonas luteola]|uniref:KAP P-loop domain protein n=1 Tax=Pseudomonas luteola TaxID=47886 RepID=A0A2X2BU96_PSELU|nr:MULTISPECIES: P-loop NTPase fold protein [Pseudomonas]SPY99922.1 KAP P-loop domain protein [Pseudomonas luteola]
MTATNDNHAFSADRPIHDISQDDLGRDKFAASLAHALLGWSGTDSLVVSLNGKWGSGKTSIKNMALELIKEKGDKKLNIIEFNPWEWAAQDQINTALFKEISKAIKLVDKTAEGKKLAASLTKYGKLLSASESVATKFYNYLPILAGATWFACLAPLFQDANWSKYTGVKLTVILSVVILILKWGGISLTKWGELLVEQTKGKELSILELKNQIKKLLAARDKPLLIVMDDIDRLTTPQLQMVFQLVKANLDFPNVVYLLLFQRDLVEAKLSDGRQQGREYIEKIIQVPFDIPSISRPKLEAILFKKLDSIISKDTVLSAKFDQNRWAKLYRGGLEHYFETLRNVHRYTSTLSFQTALVKNDSYAEINPVDLIAIECIRVFEPEVFRELTNNKEFLTANDDEAYKTNKEVATSQLNEILEKGNNKKALKTIIPNLFPNKAWALGGLRYGHGFSDTYFKELRVCHTAYFDRYFQFSIPTDGISHSKLTELVETTKNSDSFKNTILAIKDTDQLRTTLSYFEDYVEAIPLSNSVEFLTALMDLADIVEDDDVGQISFSASTCIIRITLWFLSRMQDNASRFQDIKSAFQRSTGLRVLEKIILHTEDEIKEDAPSAFFDEAALDTLKSLFVVKINAISQNDSDFLLRHSSLVSLLFRWLRFGGNPRQWVQSQVDNGNILKVLCSFVSKSVVSSGDKVRDKYYIRLEYLEEFANIESVKQAIANLDVAYLTEKENQALTLFKDALEEGNRPHK